MRLLRYRKMPYLWRTLALWRVYLTTTATERKRNVVRNENENRNRRIHVRNGNATPYIRRCGRVLWLYLGVQDQKASREILWQGSRANQIERGCRHQKGNEMKIKYRAFYKPSKNSTGVIHGFLTEDDLHEAIKIKENEQTSSSVPIKLSSISIDSIEFDGKETT